jgi:hypothetical protein
MAEQVGFEVEAVRTGGYEVDFTRSATLRRLMRLPGVSPLMRGVGRLMPYEVFLILRRPAKTD